MAEITVCSWLVLDVLVWTGVKRKKKKDKKKRQKMYVPNADFQIRQVHQTLVFLH